MRRNEVDGWPKKCLMLVFTNRPTNLCCLKRWKIFWFGMWMLVSDSGGNYLLIFLRPNDVDLDVLHDQIKLNSEVESF